LQADEISQARQAKLIFPFPINRRPGGRAFNGAEKL
jgi:hypothetical protein